MQYIKYHEAITSFNKALDCIKLSTEISVFIKRAEILEKLGSTYRKLNQIDEAINYHKQSLRLRELFYENKPHPDLAISLYNVAMALWDKGEKKESLDYMIRSHWVFFTSVGPQSHHTNKVHMSLVQHCIMYCTDLILEGKFTSINEYINATGVNLLDPNLYRQGADSYYKEGNLLDTIKCYEVLSILAKNTYVYCNMGCLYYAKAKATNEVNEFQFYLTKAEESFISSLSLSKLSSNCTEYANFLIGTKQYIKAFSYLKSAIEINDGNKLSYGAIEKIILSEQLYKEIDFHGEVSFKASNLAYYLIITNNKMLGLSEDELNQYFVDFEQSVEATPDYLSYSLLAYAYMSVKNFEYSGILFQVSSGLYNEVKGTNLSYTLAQESIELCRKLALSSQEVNLTVKDHLDSQDKVILDQAAIVIQRSWRSYINNQRNSLEQLPVER